MDSWKKDIINKNIDELKKDEIKKFAIAYDELEKEYHGYLSGLEQSVKIFSKVDKEDEFIKELSKKNYGKLWVNKDGNLYYKTSYPYLTLDGYLAILDDQEDNYDIILSVVEIGKTICIKATSKTSKGITEGVAIIDDKTDIEKAASFAVRKALAYRGLGRFPVYSTSFGEHPIVKEYREFKKGK